MFSGDIGKSLGDLLYEVAKLFKIAFWLFQSHHAHQKTCSCASVESKRNVVVANNRTSAAIESRNLTSWAQKACLEKKISMSSRTDLSGDQLFEETQSWLWLALALIWRIVNFETTTDASFQSPPVDRILFAHKIHFPEFPLSHWNLCSQTPFVASVWFCIEFGNFWLQFLMTNIITCL